MEITTELVCERVARARADRHRGLLVVRGDRPSRRELASMLERAGLRDVVELGGAVPLDGARALLGAEHDAVVLDARARLDPDAIGAVHGAVRAGGLLVLRAPDDGWNGRFAARAARVLARPEPPPPPPRLHRPPIEPDRPHAVTAEQDAALAALTAMIAADDPQPVVLVADRGRGKSAALGMAAAHALACGLDVRVLAPHEASVDVLLSFARRAAVARGVDEAQIARRLRFAGDRASLREDDHVLFVVDEAAALPVALLRELARMPRVAFATTVHGYEGTGRGFTERFLGSLERARPRATILSMSAPIRWAEGDPLERLAFDLLLLDAAPAPASECAETVRHERIDRDRLAADERLLGELFGLLVAAHYRTSPRDLATLLDAPNVEIHAALAGAHPVAAAMVSIEGGLSEETIDRVARGLERPAGHALPETLVAHGRSRDAGRLRGARIVRVATHPSLRRRGLGHGIVRAVVGDAVARGMDWTGALFGVTTELLAFWMRAGFVPVRLSVSRSSASGEHSAAVLRPCSPRGASMVSALRAALAEDLPYQLADALRALTPELALTALRGAPPREPRLSDRQREQLVAFAFGGLPFGVASGAMLELVAATIHAPVPELDDAGRRALVLTVLQHREWDEVARELGAESVPDAMRAVRRALRPLVLAFGGEPARALAARYRRRCR